MQKCEFRPKLRANAGENGENRVKIGQKMREKRGPTDCANTSMTWIATCEKLIINRQFPKSGQCEKKSRFFIKIKISVIPPLRRGHPGYWTGNRELVSVACTPKTPKYLDIHGEFIGELTRFFRHFFENIFSPRPIKHQKARLIKMPIFY
jgi:hypothetical protein